MAINLHKSPVATSKIMEELAQKWDFPSPQLAERYFQTAYETRAFKPKNSNHQAEINKIMNTDGDFLTITGTGSYVGLEDCENINKFDNHNHPLKNATARLFEKIVALPSHNDLGIFFINPTKLSSISTQNFITLMKTNADKIYKEPIDEIAKMSKPDRIVLFSLDDEPEVFKEYADMDDIVGYKKSFIPHIESLQNAMYDLNNVRFKVFKNHIRLNSNAYPQEIEPLENKAMRLFKKIGKIIGGQFEVKHWSEIFPDIHPKGGEK